MRYQNYRLLGDADVKHIRCMILPLLRDWFFKWFQSDPNFIDIEVFADINDRPIDLEQTVRFTTAGSPSKWCAIDSYTGVRESILSCWDRRYSLDLDIGNKSSDSLITDVADMILDELARIFFSVNTCDEQADLVRDVAGSVSHDEAKYLSHGGMILNIHDDSFDLNVVVSASLVDNYIASISDNDFNIKDNIVVPLSSALGGQKVEAEAILGSANLTFDELVSLKPGDVIMLDSNISDKIVLNIKNTDYSYTGSLGKREDKLAIQVVNEMTVK
ncbi:MAG: FliM/FliN family flagellar motor C-terminal domain-containing protein [Candidatus Thiodiazotropha sp. (ex Dulcina madagascariensis)]|nr:FliM/FliN family flagellar motor C-terminal domain-containing protein [Candidatus Thiodiazotropha sp. (ex Dulcina madagascariensis)]MCU7925846.1 FliM/FliN family flagellar motor C-terminal domain-containing protein [Candidatus Thiodiazotropha sp. (ex Dulcina madagascariensis)]